MQTPFETGTDVLTGQEFEILHVLWASFDDVGTPHHERTWVDLSGRMRGWGVEGGAENELGEVDATVYRCELADPNRDLDPTNSASPYDPVPNRLLWHRAQTNNQTYGIFKGYVNGWGPTPHPDGIDLHSANVRATDGEELLVAGNLEAANPDVVDYDEMVSAADPSFNYRLGEKQGTKLVGHRREIRYKKGERKGKVKRVKRWKTRETRAATTGASGPPGTYINTPLLGQPGAIAGDSDGAMRCRSAGSEYARVVVDADDFKGLTGLTVECWVKLTLLSGEAQYFVTGPMNSDDLPMFALGVDAAGSSFFFVDGTVSGSNLDGSLLGVGVWYHVVGVWSAGTQLLFVDGVQVGTTTGPSALLKQAGTTLLIGALILSGNNRFNDATLDEVAIYEKALSQPPIQAHFDAAALGFDGMGTGRRIGHVLDLVNEFPAWNVQPGVRTMPPTRYAGLQPAELIDEAVSGEGMPCAFFMSKDGVPTFLAADYRDRAPYDAPLFTVGTGMGEIPFLNPRLSDSKTFLYNIIQGTAEGGEQTFTASDPTSIGRFGRRVLPLEDLPIGSDADVQDYVDELLDLYKDPVVRITGFTLNGETAAERDALLTLDQKDCVRVHFQPEGGGTEIDQTSFVEHRRVWQDHAAEPLIYGEFGVSPV